MARSNHSLFQELELKIFILQLNLGIIGIIQGKNLFHECSLGKMNTNRQFLVNFERLVLLAIGIEKYLQWMKIILMLF